MPTKNKKSGNDQYNLNQVSATLLLRAIVFGEIVATCSPSLLSSSATNTACRATRFRGCKAQF